MKTKVIYRPLTAAPFKCDSVHNEIFESRDLTDILRFQGTIEINQLSKENFIRSRQMERLFCEYIGIFGRQGKWLFDEIYYICRKYTIQSFPVIV